MGKKDASATRLPVDQYRKQIGKQDYKKTKSVLKATRLKAEAKKNSSGFRYSALCLWPCSSGALSLSDGPVRSEEVGWAHPPVLSSSDFPHGVLPVHPRFLSPSVPRPSGPSLLGSPGLFLWHPPLPYAYVCSHPLFSKLPNTN
ncbi:triple QxxK/R motif-containing protein isoform X3 [Micropterus dolomieu]|uniref:triple QxxK/R motif-containing protein isoform X3 n=1 Tax=Micropterus dolomieu TaxID=147949 RepID=UPI001E8D417D|nr:triple QxxK/R motif-containing protein isoform X3 [Micropterus dolomieu]